MTIDVTEGDLGKAVRFFGGCKCLKRMTAPSHCPACDYSEDLAELISSERRAALDERSEELSGKVKKLLSDLEIPANALPPNAVSMKVRQALAAFRSIEEPKKP